MQNTVKFICSVIVLLAGVTIGFVSLIIPPTGVIDSSVLTFTGELLSFVGAVWGIAQYGTIQVAKIEKAADKAKS